MRAAVSGGVGGRSHENDVTFVVLKVKDDERRTSPSIS